jgi:hypothetical protein
MKTFAVVLMLCASALADQWSFFYPESVTSIGCSTQPVQLMVNGSSQRQDVWMALAHTKRDDPAIGTDWTHEVARYPLTVKGLHKAQKACSAWFDEASKRVKKAQPAGHFRSDHLHSIVIVPDYKPIAPLIK